MGRNGRYIEYLQVGSNEVVLELRVVNLLLASDKGTCLLSNKWLLPQHWDEVNKIVTQAATKHIKSNKNRSEEECDDSVCEVEGEHVKIAYCFKPYAAAIPYILSPYRNNVSTPAEALESEAGWLSLSPYRTMLIAAVGPRYIHEHHPSGSLRLEYNVLPVKPSAILDSDTDCSDNSRPYWAERDISSFDRSNSRTSMPENLSVDGSTVVLSSSVEMSVRSASGGDSRSGSNVIDRDPCPALECSSDGHENQNLYVSISKVSRYTGEESVMEAHENDLTCTQVFFQPAVREVRADSVDRFLLAPSPSPETCNKPHRRRGFNGHSGKSRRRSLLESPSTHSMSTRNSVPRESPSPVERPMASEPGDGKHVRVLLVDEADLFGDGECGSDRNLPDTRAAISLHEVSDVASSTTSRASIKSTQRDSRKTSSRARLKSLRYGTNGKKDALSAPDSARGSRVPLCRKSPRRMRVEKKQGDASCSDQVVVSSANRVSRKEGQLLLKKQLNAKYVTKPGSNVEDTSYYSHCLGIADNVVAASDELSESSLGVNKNCGEASTSKSKSSKWSDDEDINDFTPCKQKKNYLTPSEKEKEIKQPHRRRNHGGGKLKQVGSDSAESKRAKIKSATTKSDASKRKKKTVVYVDESPDKASESETETFIAAAESIETVRRSVRLRSFSNEASEKCARGTTPDVENCVSVCKQTNAQKFTMEDVSLDDLKVMFEGNISFLREINQGIRPSERHDRFRNGGLNQEHLVYALSTSPYSSCQLRQLSHLCREEFCHSLQDRIEFFGYISRVLVPDLCTKLFMDRFDMNEEQALAMIDKAYIHVPHEDDA